MSIKHNSIMTALPLSDVNKHVSPLCAFSPSKAHAGECSKFFIRVCFLWADFVFTGFRNSFRKVASLSVRISVYMAGFSESDWLRLTILRRGYFHVLQPRCDSKAPHFKIASHHLSAVLKYKLFRVGFLPASGTVIISSTLKVRLRRTLFVFSKKLSQRRRNMNESS